MTMRFLYSYVKMQKIKRISILYPIQNEFQTNKDIYTKNKISKCLGENKIIAVYTGKFLKHKTQNQIERYNCNKIKIFCTIKIYHKM